MKYVDAFNGRASQTAAVIAASLTMLLAISITTDAVARFITNRSIPGMVEVSETLLVALVFLAFGYCAYSGAHIALTLLTDALPGRITAVLRAVAFTLVALLLVWMLWATGTRALDSFTGGEYKFGLARWPLWPARTLIVVGLALTLPVYIVAIWNNVLIALGRKPVPAKAIDPAAGAIV